jgi:MFS family permease
MEYDAKESVSHADRVITTPEYHSVTDYLRENRQPIWIKKPQLRNPYAILLPAYLFVATTNGFDGSMINGLQAGKMSSAATAEAFFIYSALTIVVLVDSWQSTFNHPQGAWLGILTASYPPGAICSTPFAPIIADRYGRRWQRLLVRVTPHLSLQMRS